jgi:hypothetical protein
MNDRAEPEFSLTRARVERLLAMLDVKRANGGLNADEAKAHEVATLRLFGAGASPKKFARLKHSKSTACCVASIVLLAPGKLDV